MVYYKRRGLFETFFDNRDSLIIQYTNGDINKREFLECNFDFIQNMNVKPFSKIDSYEKGMYNYQYYNVLAKYYTMLAKDLKRSRKRNKYSRRYDKYSRKSKKYYVYYLNKGDYYYNEKDKATFQLLKYLNFENVDAYFIRAESKFLDNKLYEIVLNDYKDAIFHSKSLWLLDILREEGVFIEGKKTSLIEGYINERY